MYDAGKTLSSIPALGSDILSDFVVERQIAPF
jgi:hypothetical protein